MWLAKLVEKMSGVHIPQDGVRTVSLTEWIERGMPINPDPAPLNTRDPGY